MAFSANDIQFKELKDTVSQLNTTIRTQNDLILSLQKMLKERNAKDEEKDRIFSNLQAQLEYFKWKEQMNECLTYRHNFGHKFRSVFLSANKSKVWRKRESISNTLW